MNLMEMLKNFSDESKCRAYIEKLRWPNGAVCPSCQSTKIYRLENRPLLLCASCKYQFSVTVGTIFHDTHLPLENWFVATFLLCEAKKGMSACQIQRTLDQDLQNGMVSLPLNSQGDAGSSARASQRKGGD